ncbi:TraB/GumN family protein [Ichthyenterobacterium sp. W332]|uniref:TraB/GumN family protein n=1 Tax=Microcosmobacter mediterraneus TaxID=3075607 RepID=A0ABU2YMN8_9FLAO|nr:TraB/GumN family protein [Ichthyenterobacterium sp. W332]MDT0559432.1 TraB/GumN family protein [Ichthyenterobacterium sp. W332]
MKTIIYFLLLCITISLQAQDQKLENTLLWKISGNDLKQPSYLYGTIHITCDATLSPKIIKALDETSQLYLELDMDDPNMQMDMMKGIMMKDGITIKSLLSEEEYNLVNSFIKEELGMSLDMMNTMKPFLVGSMFYMKMLDCPMQSFEEELMKVSKAQDEEIYGLETVDEQLAVFDAIPYKLQAKDLVRSAKDKLTYDKEYFQKMLDLYSKEDLNALMLMMDDDTFESTANFNDELVVKRNKNWISKIERISKEEPTFFGVGAGHLGGKEGVIILLRQEGYKLTPILN